MIMCHAPPSTEAYTFWIYCVIRFNAVGREAPNLKIVPIHNPDLNDGISCFSYYIAILNPPNGYTVDSLEYYVFSDCKNWLEILIPKYRIHGNWLAGKLWLMPEYWKTINYKAEIVPGEQITPNNDIHIFWRCNKLLVHDASLLAKRIALKILHVRV